MARAYVGIGSNIDNPRRQVLSAVAALADLPQTRLIAVSRWYQSEAVGPGDQPDYINGAALLETTLGARPLLAEMQRLERAAGRIRGERWGPRPLDLDLLAYDDLKSDDPKLTLPHPRIAERAFVLLPLRDLGARFTLANGDTVDRIGGAEETDACRAIDLDR